MKKLALLAAGLLLAATCRPAAAHPAAPDAPAINTTDAHNLCYLFRPYGTGILLHWWIITQADVYCVDAIAQDYCVGYDARFHDGGWHGEGYHQDQVNCYI